MILKDASTNRLGIPREVAEDEDMGFDVAWVQDYAEEALEQAKKSRFGKEGPPAGMHPVVTINPKTLARVQRQRSAAKALHDDAGDAESEPHSGE